MQFSNWLGPTGLLGGWQRCQLVVVSLPHHHCQYSYYPLSPSLPHPPAQHPLTHLSWH